MLYYPHKAITTKTINKTNYNLYSDIYINMLKYNNDSSATLRMLRSFVDTASDVIEDLLYKPRFNMKEIEAITIDRFNGFVLDRIPNINIETVDPNIYASEIIGFSKYTNKEYTLNEVKDNHDFVRHSLPCDCFFGEKIESGNSVLITLYPNEKSDLDLDINDTAITIEPFSGLDQSMLIADNITLLIAGISITGSKIEEEITINSYISYKTENSFSNITSIKAIGSYATIKLILYPYVNGNNEIWHNDIIDRETFEIYPSLISVDKLDKTLLFNIINDIKVQFPIENEPYKIVDLDIPEDKVIQNYFIDKGNRLLYVATSDSTLYCFPLIIPTKYSNKLDSMKTKYQAVRVEYYEDSVNRNYTFYIFPVSRTNDVETMSIMINGIEYESDILLDLYKENIQTNRIVIPFDVLFDETDEALVEFVTYGIDHSVCPVHVCNPKLAPLYEKDLTSISIFSNPSTGMEYSSPSVTNRNTEYKQFLSGNINATEFSLFKLSNKSNILINGYAIINVFNTFNYDEESNIIITSDTITHVRGNQ